MEKQACKLAATPHTVAQRRHGCAGLHSASALICARHVVCFTGGDPQLWAEALEYFCGQPGDCSAAISEVLRHIEAGRLLPPLVVLQTLAKNKTLKVRCGRRGSCA